MSLATGSSYLQAADLVLDELASRFPLWAWAVTRTDGDRWEVLRVRGEGLPVGSVLRWSDSVCARMVRTHGSHVVPDVSLEPGYSSAPLVAELRIQAYAGMALRSADGEVIGTLCGVDPRVQPAAFLEVEALLRFGTGVLDLVRTAEEQRDLALELAGDASSRAHADALTGLGNRASWLAALDAEPQLVPASRAVVSVDVDGLKAVNDARGHAAGDRLLMATAVALREAYPDAVAVARVGGDEFLLLLDVGSDLPAVEARVRSCLEERGVSAAVGSSAWVHSAGEAWAAADRAMYTDKRSRAAGRRSVDVRGVAEVSGRRGGRPATEG